MLLYCASVLSRMPLRVHYWFADWILFPLIYHVARYRRKTVEQNLCVAFPDKSKAERKQIMKDFYHNFCDVMVETVYGYRCPEEEMKQRVDIIGMEEANRLIDAAGGGIFMLAHMGNWEWQASVQQWLSPGVTELNVYRQLKNRSFDRLMLAIRAQRGGQCVEKNQLLRTMVQFRAQHKPFTIGLICDQKPRPEVTRTWLSFLNQETGFLDGGEMLAKKFNIPVFYGHMERVSRGRYRSEVRLITATPQQTKEGEITTAFARALEQNIFEQPHLWLWTHNRFKWKKQA